MEPDIDARIAAMISALDEGMASLSWNAARDLAKIGPPAHVALPALARALRSRDATTALWARVAIVRITGEVEKHLPPILAGLRDRRVFPGMAHAAIAMLGPQASAAVAELIEDLSNPNGDVRALAASALGRTGEAAAPAVPALAERLQDEDEKVRWYAAAALADLGPLAGEATPALIAALEDFDDDVRGHAARALGAIGQPSAHIVAALSALAEDENPNVRAAAADATRRLTTEDTEDHRG